MMKRIIVKNVFKTFKIGFRKRQSALMRIISLVSGRGPKKKIRVLKGVSLDVGSGEILGIIGKNGSGKSTLLRVIAGIYKADKGKIQTFGKIISLLNLRAGLKTRLTVKENIELCCSFFGLSSKQISQRYKSILNFSELEQFAETKVYQLSQGMRQRLSFSIAIHCEPEILLLDEVFEVGDKSFKKKSANKLKNLVKNGASIILVTHETDLIKKYCKEVIWLENGKIKQKGEPKKILKKYQNE